MSLANLNDAERKIHDDIIANGLDESSEDYKKELIKQVVRYEVDNYVIDDPMKEDPIVVSDEDIEKNMDDLLKVYNDTINKPYLVMNSNLNVLNRTRKSLKYYELTLYARKKFSEVDLGIDDPNTVTQLQDINTESGNLMSHSKIEEDSNKASADIRKNDASRLLVDYLMKLKYGGKDMSQLDLIVEKLNFDMERLNESTDSNKEMNIKDTQKAIDIINTIGKLSETDDIPEWYNYFLERMVTDKRAVSIAKEIKRDVNKAKAYVDKIFGPELVNAFIDKYIESNGETEKRNIIQISALLMMYNISKKVESDMKSRSNRSLIFRGYIIHYMLDDLTPEENTEMTNMFKDLFELYWRNDKLLEVLTSKEIKRQMA